jgi:tight adherence protein B
MTSSAVAALALAVAAGFVGVSASAPRDRLRRLARSDGGGGLVGWPRRHLSQPPAWVLVWGAVAVGAVLGTWLGGPVAGVAAAAYGGLGVRVAVRRRRRRTDAAAHQSALDAVAGLADDLRAGRAPAVALTAAVEAIAPGVDDTTRSALRCVVGAAAAGIGVPPALRAVSHPALRALFERLAAVWALSDAGVPLAELLDRLESELRAGRRAAERAAAQLAAARTTAHLLAGLPVVGLLLGHLLGAAPLDVIRDTTLGGLSAVAAIAFQIAGSAWVHRISRPTAVGA